MIICEMTESWQSRKARLIKVRDEFPTSLRKIPLRHIESVAGLSPDALRALERAFLVEPVNIPRALQYLREHLVISVEDLVDFARTGKSGPKPRAVEAGSAAEEKPVEVAYFRRPGQVDSAPAPEDVETLARLLMSCYPNMPEITAQATAASGVMREALRVVAATRLAIESDQARSDFVILALLKLFGESRNQVLQIIRGNPAFQKALEESQAALE
jgi:hypothetical protein